MCIAIPKKIISINPLDKTAEVIHGSGRLTVSTALIEKIPDGSYAIIQSGMIINVMSAEEASESLKLWKEFTE